MKTGTKSLLFGVHQFVWHPFTVWRAWRHLYGKRPDWRTTVCIVIHDWGYWGCAEMDGAEGEQHPFFGAELAGFLFGSEFYDLVLWHSRYLSKKHGKEPSQLCWADKISMIYDPTWFYLIRARLSGELKEYRANADTRGFIPLAAPDEAWHRKLVEHLRVMSKEKAAEFARREWIEEVTRIWKDRAMIEPTAAREMAEAMVPEYYDDPDFRSSPSDAVEEELMLGL